MFSVAQKVPVLLSSQYSPPEGTILTYQLRSDSYHLRLVLPVLELNISGIMESYGV